MTIHSKLEEIGLLANELNKERDSISADIKKIEFALAASKVGVFVRTVNAHAVEGRAALKLGYERVKDRWCIVYSRDEADSLGHPLLEAPMEVRVGLLPFLPELLDALMEPMQKHLADVKAARKILEEHFEKT